MTGRMGLFPLCRERCRSSYADPTGEDSNAPKFGDALRGSPDSNSKVLHSSWTPGYAEELPL